VTASVAAVPEITRITLRQLVSRRRALLLVLLSAAPVALAVVARLFKWNDAEGFGVLVLNGLALVFLLPLVAVLFGTAAFGAEIEDGTIVYLMAKPVGRWAIVVAKLLSTTAVTAALTIGSVLVASAIAELPLGQQGVQVTEVYVTAMAVGSICYVSLFVAFSLFTRRALLIGLGYMLIWEGALSNLLPGIANLSIRQYALGAGQLFYDLPPRQAALEPQTALPLAAILVVVAAVVATWRLMRFEISGSGD
jgi:ABC-2 type transport system permease protein